MQFEYEIGPGEYVASQILYSKLSLGRKRFKAPVLWILGGLVFIFLARARAYFGWGELFLMLVGVWWIYAAIVNLFPARYYRRAYKGQDLAGKKFNADMNEQGFEVLGEYSLWRVQWPGVRLKGESENVFVICSAGTIFMFGKKYLTDDQQHELRKLAGLVSSAKGHNLS